jgi:hypothetical protein
MWPIRSLFLNNFENSKACAKIVSSMKYVFHFSLPRMHEVRILDSDKYFAELRDARSPWSVRYYCLIITIKIGPRRQMLMKLSNIKFHESPLRDSPVACG